MELTIGLDNSAVELDIEIGLTVEVELTVEVGLTVDTGLTPAGLVELINFA